MIIKEFYQFVNELTKVPSNVSVSGSTIQQDVIYSDNPTSAKSRAASVLLRNQLQRAEILSDEDEVYNMDDNIPAGYIKRKLLLLIGVV